MNVTVETSPTPGREDTRYAYETEPWARFYQRRWGGHAESVGGSIRRFYESTPVGAREVSLLDVCCGTGHLARSFLDAGYDVVGIDLSRAMIDVASTCNAADVNAGRVEFLVADAADFALDRRFGLAVSTFDSLNLLPDLDTLRRCFARVAEAVVPGGWFIFDLNTRRGFREEWAGCRIEETDDDLLFVQGVYDGGSRAYARFSGFVRDPQGYWRRFEENPIGQVFDAADVLGALRVTGWDSAWPASPPRLYERVKNPDELPRMHFVARRAGGED